MSTGPEEEADLRRVEPSIRTSEPNEPHVIYRGPLELDAGTNTTKLSGGGLELRWLPQAEIRFQGESAEDGAPPRENEGRLRIPSLLTSANVIVARVGFSFPGWSVTGTLNELVWLGPDRPMGALRFALCNFPVFAGVVGREDLGYWPRWEADFGPWTVTIDGVPRWSTLEKQLKAEGGFAVSHGGLLRRRDDAPFVWKDAQSVLTALQFFFAFCAGGWSGPILPSSGALEQGGGCLLGPWLLSEWRKARRSWFDLRSALWLSPAAARFAELWGEDEWRLPLTNFVWWYVEGVRATTSELRIVICQTALELLGWVVVVEERGLVSREGYGKLGAADQVGLLLSDLRIPKEIPDHLDELKKLARSYNDADGPTMISAARNKIVHPSPRSRSGLSAFNRTAKAQVGQLALRYVELGLLSVLGYEGPVRDQTAVWGGKPDDIVPWASADDEDDDEAPT